MAIVKGAGMVMKAVIEVRHRSVTWSAGDVKEPTHLSKRVGHVVPGVVVYL